MGVSPNPPLTVGSSPVAAAVSDVEVDADGDGVVGLELVDVEVARRASVRVCVARYGFGFDAIEPKDLSGDELFVDRAGEIAGLLERIAG